MQFVTDKQIHVNRTKQTKFLGFFSTPESDFLPDK